jgi:GTPases
MVVSNKAILVSVSDGKYRAEEVEEHLNELAFLAETAGMEAKFRFVQRLPSPDNRTYVVVVSCWKSSSTSLKMISGLCSLMMT